MPIPRSSDIEWMPPTHEQDADDPLPLLREVSIPAFPTDSLPEPIAAMVEDVAGVTQTDPAMAGTAALTVLAACTGGCAEIEIRADWREPLNVFMATVANPGERKSAVQRMMVSPLLDIEQKLAEASGAARSEAELRKDIQIQAAEQAKKTAVKSANKQDWDAAMSDAISAKDKADSITVPPILRLVADDITPEAAGTLLAEQNGRLAIISAEGGLFDIMAGRYTASLNLDVWLKGHAGDPLKIDRKNRPPEYIRRPALTVGLMIQPSVLDAIAANPQFRGRGLLARFFYAFPVSKLGSRLFPPPPLRPGIRRNYDAAIIALAEGMSQTASEPAVLTLTPEAQAAIQSLEEAVEPTLAGDGELADLADWGAKYVGTVARIAGLIHLACHGSTDGPRQLVTAETIQAARRVGQYYKACAVKAFATMGTDLATANAEYLLSRIRSLQAEEFSERDISRVAKRFKNRNEMQPSITRLIDDGWLSQLPPPPPTGGRPASPRYRLAVTKGQK